MLPSEIVKGSMYDLFFELIRVSISRQERLSQRPSAVEWQKLYSLAVEQALVGICFEGVRKELSASKGISNSHQMASNLYYDWLGRVVQIELRSEMMNSRCVTACTLLRNAGFETGVLKGQGLAQLYGQELSKLRQTGDIDLWVKGGMKKTMEWVKKHYGMVEFDYINAHLPIFADTEVELHRRVSCVPNLLKNHILQRWINEH